MKKMLDFEHKINFPGLPSRRFLQMTMEADETSGGSSSASQQPTSDAQSRTPGPQPPPPAGSTVIVTSQSSDDMQSHKIIVAFLIGIILFLSAALMFLTAPPMLRFIRRKLPVSQKRINRRYETIERWLISKRVRCHDENCQHVTGRPAVPKSLLPSSKPPSAPPSQGTTTTTPTAAMLICDEGPIIIEPSLHGTEDTFLSSETSEEEPSAKAQEEEEDDDDDDVEQNTASPLECSICLEVFAPNEIVSWSTNVSCPHAYHHECIKEWLLRRAGCPFCRKVVLAVDCKGSSNFTERELEKLIDQWRHRTMTTYFCIQEGLVVLERPNKDVAAELSTAEKELIVPCVKLDELRARRGGRSGAQSSNPSSPSR